jgi:hypothetical protein
LGAHPIKSALGGTRIRQINAAQENSALHILRNGRTIQLRHNISPRCRNAGYVTPQGAKTAGDDDHFAVHEAPLPLGAEYDHIPQGLGLLIFNKEATD